MGLYLLNSCFTRINAFSGACRLLNPRYSVFSVDDKGLKQSIAAKLNIPEEPKRPLTPYMKYLKQIRPALVKENPSLSIGELSKIASERWRNLDHNSRIDFERHYQEERESYKTQKSLYFSNLSEEQKFALEQEKQKIIDTKNKKILKQKAKSLEKPKKPLSSYMLFSASRSKDRGNTSVLEWQKQLSKEWKSLDQSQKEKFTNESKALHEKYAVELQQWENKMISLGNVDLVRTLSLVEKPKSKSKK